ncbi:glycosyltransferase family 2 protein [Novilysobacter spongiicola]|uniref:Glycosyltransferase involved in cell wall bisynthesis n=1 Tax=Lysobacter spongiicola DSM 21749 TaxID=1122188 RepID=A0A1T4SH51_9GAMM|nr:glycosyltransferase family 2 protein [Lysobacter spongiicola]SKA27624.1 Glycosyltransferase involved in cell wall bisynthesis [Lysobacter spongiicola DSM 21749]
MKDPEPAPAPVAPLRPAAAVRIAVVVPCHRVRRHILQMIDALPPLVSGIYVIDDRCPDGSGELVRAECRDPRVSVLFNSTNLGVGGAVMAGYARAVAEGFDIIVKMDGDGQMDPAMLPRLVAPIVRGEADYTKGNRFYDLAEIGQMPAVRIFGNSILSFLTKISSGYWDIFDPTNGYTAVHANVAARLPFHKISNRYFFETDLLFRLNTLRAVVIDVPMDARYGDESSGLKISRIVGEFALKHARNTLKRVFYNYFLRDLSLASVELVLGALLVCIGAAFGVGFWVQSAATGVTATAGGVMLAALPTILGIQLLLGFIAYDIASVPQRVVHPKLPPP